MLITPRIHKIGSFVNQYLLVDNDDLTLIDAGMQSNAKNLLKYIEKAGFKPESLKQILITHSDTDHYGAVNGIREASGAKVLTSNLEAIGMKTGSSSRQITPKGFFALIFPLLGGFLSAPPTLVNKTIEDGDTLPILDGMKVIAAPGHTPGQLAFFLPEERILFAGDSIKESAGKPVPNLDATTSDPDKARETFEKLMKLDPQVIGCGHAYFDLRK
jgi:glyoxylase-like metal-dependent hydrolase (beta-lactamase superfamily II)